MASPTRPWRRPQAPEQKAERDFVKWVAARGGMTRKLNGLGHRDWPDQLVTTEHGAKFMIEFKRETRGKPIEPTRSQALLHEELRALGWLVHVCDTLAEAQHAYEMEDNQQREFRQWLGRQAKLSRESAKLLNPRR